jgi:hypothetical protein
MAAARQFELLTIAGGWLAHSLFVWGALNSERSVGEFPLEY